MQEAFLLFHLLFILYFIYSGILSMAYISIVRDES